MHKLFFRNFFSILLLSLVILVVITSSVFLFYSNGAKDWREAAFDEFANEIKQELTRENVHVPVDSVIKSVLNKASDDRICGYIISDIDSGRILVFGRTRYGEMLSDRNIPKQPGKQRTRENLSNAKKLDFAQSTINIEENAELPSTCPAPVSPKDIVGSIVFSISGEDMFVLDILTDSPDTYVGTKELVKTITVAMTVALPSCLLIALVGAWIISSKASKSVKRINMALTELSNEKENVNPGHFTSVEFNNIAKEICNLDACLQANRKSRQAWLNSISHDLNTPVQAMRFLIDGMNDGLIKKTKATILDLQKENDNLASKIGKVMLYSTIQSMSQAELSELDSKNLLDDLTKDKNIETEIKTEKIVCNENLMSHALTELIENAFKFKEDDSSVKICLDKDDSDFVITVSNKGHLNKMQEESDPFEPWTKSDFSRNSEGSGLGLPIAGSAVRLHKGTASLKCENGTVTATIRWPYLKQN